MANHDETQVDVNALESAVRELTKAAGETSLSKGGIENSGTTSDGKPAGGGQTSDFGVLDDMMIGKMAAAGIDAGMISSFGQFLAKMEDGEDEEEDEEEEAAKSAARRPAPRAARLQKSAMEQLREDPILTDNFDASDYLEHITMRVAEQIDSVRKSMTDERVGQQRFNAALAKSTVEMARMVKSQVRVINEMGKRLGIVEAAPVAQPRGATSVRSAKALNKSMPGEQGGSEHQLRKSELLATLTYINLEKGIKQIQGQRINDIVTLYEGGGVLDQATVDFAKGWLAANPNEAELAKSYS